MTLDQPEIHQSHINFHKEITTYEVINSRMYLTLGLLRFDKIW